jgi:hypothetical protein
MIKNDKHEKRNPYSEAEQLFLRILTVGGVIFILLILVKWA